LSEDEHTRDESREMATDIMATSTTKLTLFLSILLARFTRFALTSLKCASLRSAQRRDMLIGNSPLVGDHNLIFHEAGVPPIHTPMNLLVDLDDKVKERLFVVHVTGSQIPADSGLKQANEWDTMEIEVDDGKGEVDEFGRLLESLTLLTDNFSFTTETFKVLSENAEKKVWERGTTIMEKDATIEHLFVFTSGIALEQTEEGEMNRTYKPGDYTGENAFVGDGAKTMFKITAGTKVHAVQVPIAVIKPFLNNEKTLKEIAAVAALQSDGTWTSTSHNMVSERASEP